MVGREKTSCNVNTVETISKLGMLCASLKSKEDTDNNNGGKNCKCDPKKVEYFSLRRTEGWCIHRHFGRSVFVRYSGIVEVFIARRCLISVMQNAEICGLSELLRKGCLEGFLCRFLADVRCHNSCHFFEICLSAEKTTDQPYSVNL